MIAVALVLTILQGYKSIGYTIESGCASHPEKYKCDVNLLTVFSVGNHDITTDHQERVFYGL